jgi:hypothetical protein
VWLGANSVPCGGAAERGSKECSSRKKIAVHPNRRHSRATRAEREQV